MNLTEQLQAYAEYLATWRDREVKDAEEFRLTRNEHLGEARGYAHALSSLYSFTRGEFGVYMDDQPKVPYPEAVTA